MAWASLNTYTAADKVRHDMFNSLANDDRNWGGPVNGGGYALSNVILDGTAKASAQTPWLQVVDAAGFRLHSLGNVGIGNTAISPGGLPDANTGNIQTIIGRITATATAGECHLVGNAASGTMGILGFANYALAGTEKRLGVIYGATDGANNSGAVVFQTMNAGTLAERVRITKTGDVGIGITPSSKFQVEGGRIIHSVGAVSAQMFAISAGAYFGSFSNHDVTLRTNDVDRMTISVAGNVGIGTASPSQPLHILHSVAGAPASSGSTQAGGYLRLQAFSVGIDFGVYPNAIHWIQAYGSIDTNLANVQHLALQPNGGNVGIGKAVPGSRLAVSGLPTSASGLTSGDIWYDTAAGNVLKIVP